MWDVKAFCCPTHIKAALNMPCAPRLDIQMARQKGVDDALMRPEPSTGKRKSVDAVSEVHSRTGQDRSKRPHFSPWETRSLSERGPDPSPRRRRLTQGRRTLSTTLVLLPIPRLRQQRARPSLETRPLHLAMYRSTHRSTPGNASKLKGAGTDVAQRTGPKHVG